MVALFTLIFLGLRRCAYGWSSDEASLQPNLHTSENTDLILEQTDKEKQKHKAKIRQDIKQFLTYYNIFLSKIPNPALFICEKNLVYMHIYQSYDSIEPLKTHTLVTSLRFQPFLDAFKDYFKLEDPESLSIIDPDHDRNNGITLGRSISTNRFTILLRNIRFWYCISMYESAGIDKQFLLDNEVSMLNIID